MTIQIEMKYPGKVATVNKKIYGVTEKPITDYDIELDNAIIQVKLGTGKKVTPVNNQRRCRI